MRWAFLAVALLPAVPALARSPACDRIGAAKRATYGFRPTRLDQDSRNAKAKELDAFWDLVKSQGAEGRECLRRLLAKEARDSFFLFDGASLLHSLDPTAASAPAVTEAVLRSDLREVEPSGCLRLCLQLSRSGADIGPLAMKYLRQPNAEARVPQHFMTVDRITAAVVLFGSMRADLAERYAAAALADPDATVQAPAALVLAINMTEGGFKALQSFSGELPAEIRKEVLSYRTRQDPGPASAAPAFSREKVLEVIRRIPHSEEDLAKVLREQERYREERARSEPESDGQDAGALAARIVRDVEEGEPFLGIAGATRFMESASLTLEERDLPELREARRKSIHGLSDESLHEFVAYTRIIEAVVNRLDLYRQYRIHPG